MYRSSSICGKGWVSGWRGEVHGGYITKPRNELHTMWNAGKVPARMIEVIQPAGFEGFFWELAEHLAARAPDPDAVARMAEKYGLIFQEAPWLPDVVTRYGLPHHEPLIPS